MTDVASRQSGGEPRASEARSRVLLVDDREENLTALRAILEPLQVPTREARSGEEALRALLEEEFALILLDVDMPHMNGFQTAELIKQHPRTADIPIIFLTAFDEPLARAGEGYSFGAVDYIAKPYDPFVLLSKVRAFLDLYDKNMLLARQAKQLERHVEELRLSRAALADAQRIANLGSWEYDPSSGRIRASRQFHDIFGEPRDNPLPPAAELFSRLRLDRDGRRGDVVLHTATRSNFDAELTRPDGTSRHVVVHVERRPDALQMIGTIQDVTEQLEARRALDEVMRALEHEREVVQVFQDAAATPLAARVPQVQICYWYQPAEAAVVGGDWYDVIGLGNGEILLVIGDVAGHGLPAASAMAELRTALRVLSMRETRPRRIVDELDRFIHIMRPGVFVTMLLLRFDPRSGTCTQANAGHPPLAELGRDGVTFHEGAVGPPLGIALGSRPDEHSFVLAPEQTLVMYTDGLVERRGQPFDDGLLRLARCLSTLAPDCASLAQDLVSASTEEDLRDDVAVLTLHRLAATSDFATTVPADAREVAQLRRSARAWLESFDGGKTETEDALLALSEIVTNACIHAYPLGTTGTVTVEAHVDDAHVDFRVLDQGEWRAPREGEGGRGLRMAQRIASEMSIEPLDAGTVVTIRCPLRARPVVGDA